MKLAEILRDVSNQPLWTNCTFLPALPPKYPKGRWSIYRNIEMDNQWRAPSLSPSISPSKTEVQEHFSESRRGLQRKKPFLSRVEMWRLPRAQHWLNTSEELAAGYDARWDIWKSLNKLRIATAKTRATLNKWMYQVNTAFCNCGELQTTTPLEIPTVSDAI